MTRVKKRGTTKHNSQGAASGSKSSAKKTPANAASKKAVLCSTVNKRKANSESLSNVLGSGQRSGVGAAESSDPKLAAGSDIQKSSAVSRNERSASRNGKAGRRAPTRTMPSATSQDPIQFSEERERKVITYLSTKELREFKALLLAKREELAGDVKLLTSEALNRTERGSGEQSSMPIHMADLGTDAWEQDFTLGLIASEKALVREIDEALERIADRTYGICVATDKPIPRERLHAKPWAKYCIEYARLREEGRAP